MHILIRAKDGRLLVRRKRDVRAVEPLKEGGSVILFEGSRNTPIQVHEQVDAVYHLYLRGK